MRKPLLTIILCLAVLGSALLLARIALNDSEKQQQPNPDMVYPAEGNTFNLVPYVDEHRGQLSVWANTTGGTITTPLYGMLCDATDNTEWAQVLWTGNTVRQVVYHLLPSNTLCLSQPPALPTQLAP